VPYPLPFPSGKDISLLSYRSKADMSILVEETPPPLGGGRVKLHFDKLNVTIIFAVFV
jgi:hypothetical protein